MGIYLNPETRVFRNRNYSQRLEHYKGNMLLVSINYNSEARNTSKDFKHHTCRIENA